MGQFTVKALKGQVLVRDEIIWFFTRAFITQSINQSDIFNVARIAIAILKSTILSKGGDALQPQIW